MTLLLSLQQLEGLIDPPYPVVRFCTLQSNRSALTEFSFLIHQLNGVVPLPAKPSHELVLTEGVWYNLHYVYSKY